MDWVERDQLSKFYRTSNMFFFPSHEGAGMVVPEAFSYGLPVLCFQNCGPGFFVNEKSGIRVAYSNYNQSIHDFSLQILKLYQNQILLKTF